MFCTQVFRLNSNTHQYPIPLRISSHCWSICYYLNDLMSGSVALPPYVRTFVWCCCALATYAFSMSVTRNSISIQSYWVGTVAHSHYQLFIKEWNFKANERHTYISVSNVQSHTSTSTHEYNTISPKLTVVRISNCLNEYKRCCLFM